MLTVEQAHAAILRHVQSLSPDRLPLHSAIGCKLANTVRAPISLQPFDNAAVDGYALRATDIAHASRQNPVRLRVIEEISAGRAPRKTVAHRQASRIFTGAPLPRGTDAVIMQEDTATENNNVLVFDTARRGENIRRAGEDVRKGQNILPRNKILDAGAFGLLASLGIAHVNVIPSPRIGILVTGDELVPLGRKLRRGQIYDSNSIMLAALVRSYGGVPITTGAVGDTRAALRTHIRKLTVQCDAIITVGGVSVGKYDLVKPVLEELGARLQFWKVAMKPGKPFVFGKLRGIPVFGLPGNPVSAFVTFLLLVRPAILKLRGLTNIALPVTEAVAAESFENHGDRRHFVRAILKNGRVRAAGRQGSHVLSSLAAANCLLDLPVGKKIARGVRVRVLQLAL